MGLRSKPRPQVYDEGSPDIREESRIKKETHKTTLPIGKKLPFGGRELVSQIDPHTDIGQWQDIRTLMPKNTPRNQEISKSGDIFGEFIQNQRRNLGQAPRAITEGAVDMDQVRASLLSGYRGNPHLGVNRGRPNLDKLQAARDAEADALIMERLGQLLKGREQI
jgi:hypothetical protein